VRASFKLGFRDLACVRAPASKQIDCTGNADSILKAVEEHFRLDNPHVDLAAGLHSSVAEFNHFWHLTA
jgi:hypothetical protein